MNTTKIIALAIFVAACGGSAPAKKVVKPVEVVVAPPPPPPPTPLTLQERLAFHASCFADFVGEVPESFTRCFSVSSTQDLVDSGQPLATGTPEIAAATRPLWESFKLEGETRMVLAAGDHALTIALVRGTHDGKPFNGLPASQKTFGVFIAESLTLDDQGRHGAVRNYLDIGGMMGQLGAGPKGQTFRKPYEPTGRPAFEATGTGSEAETANVAAVQGAFDLFNKQDWKGVAATYLADAAISEQTAAADTEGGKAIGKYYVELGKAFPDARQAVDTIWGAGDFVVAETTFTGTNDGPAPALGVKKATKKAVTLHRAHVFRLDGGKVLQHWIFGNGMAMAIQLGLVTPPAPPPAS